MGEGGRGWNLAEVASCMRSLASKFGFGDGLFSELFPFLLGGVNAFYSQRQSNWKFVFDANQI